MMLNLVWAGLLLVGVSIGLIQAAAGDVTLLPRMQSAIFEAARQGFDLSWGLVGIMSLWLGLMKIGEQAGLVHLLARGLAPLLRCLMPDVPAHHPATGSITMNMGANLLGLDNAATPLGLKAMQDLQTLNPTPDTASDPMIMFLVLNSAGLTLIPTAVLALRQTIAIEQGLSDFNAADILLPTLMSTFIAWTAGLIAVARMQRIALWQPPLVALWTTLVGLLGLLAWAMRHTDPGQLAQTTGNLGSALLLALMIGVIGVGLLRRVDVYSSFISGAKEGLHVALGIVPYLIAMLVAVAVFRSAGALDVVLHGVTVLMQTLGWDSQFVPALPVGLMKILSGSGARALMVDVMHTYGVNHFAARLAAIMQGSSETTLYVLAVYFGSVDIRKTRYALGCALFADLAGLIGAIGMAYLFF